MLELLGLLGGALARLAPEAIRLWGAGADRAHELEMTRLQLEIDRARAASQLDLAHAQAAAASDAAELGAIAEALRGQGERTGLAWADALSATVRPVLTYWWCMGLYTAYKAVAVAVAVRSGAPLEAFAALLVTEFDRAAIGSMLGFWFLDRALRRAPR